MPKRKSARARKSQNKARFFTLLEITICIAILSLVASFMGWHIKSMVDGHRFQKDVDRLVRDVRKFQIIALTHRADIEVHVCNQGNQMGYLVKTNEPHAEIPRFFVPLTAIQAFTFNKKQTSDFTLRIHSSAWIEPSGIVGLFQDSAREKGLYLDLSAPPQIALYRDGI